MWEEEAPTTAHYLDKPHLILSKLKHVDKITLACFNMKQEACG